MHLRVQRYAGICICSVWMSEVSGGRDVIAVAGVQEVPCRRGWPVFISPTTEQRAKSGGQPGNLRMPYLKVKVRVVFDYKCGFVIRG